MKKLYTLLLVACTSMGFAQVTITAWNFDGDNLTATTGTGTLTLIGGTTEGYAAGNSIVTGTDRALNITNFPADATASGTAGLQANVSTLGFTGISVAYDRKGSNTASKWEQFEYSLTGTAPWIVLGNNGGTLTNVGAGVLWPTTTYTLPAGAANNPSFACRMVSIFAPGTSAYAQVGTGTYGTGGTWRFDNLTVSGTSLGLKENSISGLKVYPNPVRNGNLYVSSDNNSTKSVAIFDILGKQVMSANVAAQPMNVSALHSGVYIVKITEDGKTATRKLVVE